MTTASGLQYIDSAIGTGPQADSGKRLTVNYVGRLARPDSLIFDSNVLPDFGHMQPFEFRLGVGDVIKGWDQGIAGMRVGGRRRLIIPPGLAYGNRALDRIPANSTLIFDVELLSIK